MRADLTLKSEISDADFLKDRAQKITDRNPKRWLTLEAFEKQVEG